MAVRYDKVEERTMVVTRTCSQFEDGSYICERRIGVGHEAEHEAEHIEEHAAHRSTIQPEYGFANTSA